MNRYGQTGQWAARALALLFALLVAPAGAQIAMKVNGQVNFNVPADLSNYVHVDFGTTTLASQVTAGRISLGGTAFTFPTTPTLTAFSGERARLSSGNGTGSTATSTINFTSYPSFVEFLWGVSVDYENSLRVTFTLNDDTTVVVNNCQANTSACVGGYAPSSWVSDLLAGILGLVFGSGDPTYDTAHVSYTPPTGKTIKKIDFWAKGYRNCFIIFLCSNKSHYIYVDSLRFLNAAAVPHHMQVTTGSATAAGGSTVTFSITACHNAGCTTPHNTNGITGTFAVAVGGGMSVSYPDGQAFTINPGASSTTVRATISGAGTATASLSGLSKTPSAGTAAYCGFGGATPSSAAGSCDLSITTPLHHIRISASNGLTCTPLTYTLVACSNADCSQKYPLGVSGNLAVSGAGMTANFPDGAGFSTSVDANATDTVSVHATTVGSLTTATLSGLSTTPTGSPSVYCGMNGATPASGGSCTVTLASSGLFFTVPDHASDAAQSVTVTAVNSSNAAACTPAFASVSKDINFKCTYGIPGSGTRAVRVGGSALNAANNASAACDGTGRSVSLAFNASGVATTTVQYADVGSLTLTGLYSSSSGSDAGLSMTGNDSFVTWPYDFGVSITSVGNLTAGSAFNATVTARNASGTATPNFARETPSAEGVTLGFVRARPSGTSAVNGSFTGSVGAFTNGVATSTNLIWSEVGRGDVTAVLTSGNYQSTGAKAAGSSAGNWTLCAAEGGTCTLPTGATAMVSYGASGRFYYRAGETGSVACTNGVFGDPISGTAKSCYYTVTSGANTGVAGAAGPFLPAYFDVTATQACNATFTYSGQPFTVGITARNATGAITSNYDGSINTSPNYAKEVTLSTPSVATGTLSNAAVAVSAFAGGTASILKTASSPVSFAFTSPPQAATTVALRAIDTDGISSSGHAEGSVAIRSGRLKFSNAFGSEKSNLRMPVQAQYWSGKAWVLNSADTAGCTVVPSTAVALSNYVNYKGASTTIWTTSASGVTITNGSGELVLATPTLTGSAGPTDRPVGSVALALNLGPASSTSDTSCVSGTHPATVGANLSWLRAINGSCSASLIDPSAKITFGVYTPESNKTIHVREIF